MYSIAICWEQQHLRMTECHWAQYHLAQQHTSNQPKHWNSYRGSLQYCQAQLLLEKLDSCCQLVEARGFRASMLSSWHLGLDSKFYSLEIKISIEVGMRRNPREGFIVDDPTLWWYTKPVQSERDLSSPIKDSLWNYVLWATSSLLQFTHHLARQVWIWTQMTL